MSSDAERWAKAIAITLNPQNYKICEGCDSIVSAKANLCPNCHAYNFDSDELRVVDQAIMLGARDQVSVTKDDLFS